MNQHSRFSRRLVQAASIYLAALILATGLLGAARAAVVLSHSGDTDPATEGWTLVSKKPDLHSGEAADDGGTPAWKIQDSEVINSGGGSWYYRGDTALTPQDITDLLTQGWAIRATLRADDSVASGYDETPGLTPGIQIAFETENEPGTGDATAGLWVLLGLGLDENGDTTYSLKGGYPLSPTTTGTIPGGGYHSYEILWDADTNTVDLFVDSEEAVSDYAVATNSFADALGNRLFWGSMDSPGIGAGYWDSVEFEIDPATGGPLEGDLNDDGIVGSADLDIVRSFWGQTVEQGNLLEGDPSNDGLVGAADLDIVRANWGQGMSPSASAVPEPVSGFLLLGGLIGLLWRYRG